VRPTLAAGLGLLAALAMACSDRAWRAGSDGAPPRAGDSVAAATEAARAREWDFYEALHPGARAAFRRRLLATDRLDAFERVGRDLFFEDAPWEGEPGESGAQAAGGEDTPPVTPMHTREGPPSADATRCAGCHHAGGAGGAGTFADLALFDGTGDDVLTADRRLPPMLAGAALLERAAEGDAEKHPFGWRGDRPRTLREMIAWSVRTHLGVTPSDDAVDALTAYVATLPPPSVRPPLRPSLALRVASGAERFHAYGCATCHADALPVDSPILHLSRGRSLDLSALLSPDGRPPLQVRAFTDLRLHRIDAGDPRPVVTPPLWGLASRGPFLHDGRASTLRDAIAAHDVEARTARDAWTRDVAGMKDVELFLLTLSREPRLEWSH
jgi:hypothetical protein